ncbi:protein RER1B, partial [Raphanus sativus]|uniref:Protein RER1B n=1 Tax=Raphanus sativus TaxID=3726 RepID=A0A6J0LWQ5_RAPSA
KTEKGIVVRGPHQRSLLGESAEKTLFHYSDLTFTISIHGFYIISYALGIYLLNLLIGFLSPLVDPELDNAGGASLPTRGSDEFKPFIRRLPEFKFWYSITKAFCIAFLMTFFSVFDVPVFWPILLCYWVVLFFLTMRRQISHMIKHKYIPFTIGKQKYSGRRSSAE